jgi:co-chaperonin GroES (HSP10)
MKPIARGYRVIIELPAVEKVTAAGIILRESTLDREEITCTTGTIVDIGEFAFKEYPVAWYKIGETVIFAEHSGRLWKDNETGKSYRIVNDLDILAAAE